MVYRKLYDTILMREGIGARRLRRAVEDVEVCFRVARRGCAADVAVVGGARARENAGAGCLVSCGTRDA